MSIRKSLVSGILLTSTALINSSAFAIDINMNDMMNPSKWMDNNNNDKYYQTNPYGYGMPYGYNPYGGYYGAPANHPPANGYGNMPGNAHAPGYTQLAEPPSPNPPGHGTAADPNIAIRDAEIKRLKSRIEELEKRCGSLHQGYR